MEAFHQLSGWPCDNVAAAAIAPDGTAHTWGDTSRRFPLASITKLFTAAAVLLAVEEGSVERTTVVDDRGATVADLLAHSSGIAPNGKLLDDPGRRRIYSNAGYEQLARIVEHATEIPFATYLDEGIFQPFAMTSTSLRASPAFGAESTVDDLVLFMKLIGELLAPATMTAMTSPHLPELIGVLPGYGRQSPNLWGLGPEIRGAKSPHWTGTTNSPGTWGHFGHTGTFLWFDPEVTVCCVVLTDRAFDDWAKPLWPTFSDHVRAELSA